jgi:hypothetical protein
MSGYTIRFSNPALEAVGKVIFVPDGTKNTQSTSLTLVGKNYPGYGEAVETDLVHLLENFASTSPPSNPIEGQLWFDSEKKKLNVNNGGGATWLPINGLYQQPSAPINTAQTGDIWVDTNKKQLYIYNGTSFTLVGPTSGSGTSRTGSYPTDITDIYGQPHSVIVNYANDVPVEIISSEEFVPNPVIDGFSTLRPGLNVSTANVGAVDNPIYPKINGVATAAANLQISIPTAQTISADAFLRNDIDQRMLGSLSIANDNNSLQIGTEPTFILYRDASQPSKAIFSNIKTSGQYIFRSNDDVGNSRSILTIHGGTQRVGINTYPSTPGSTLDIKGTLNVSSGTTLSTLYITSTLSTSTEVINNAVVVEGGVGIGGTLVVTGEHILNGPLSIGENSTATVDPAYTATSVLLPSRKHDAIPYGYDIGSPDLAWRNVYASQYQGPTGVTAQFIGNAATASKLSIARAFSFAGDLSSVPLTFDGTSAVTFITTANNALITGKTTTATSTATDMLLVYGERTQKLYSHSKKDFLSDINYTPNLPTGVGYLVPAGTIMPHAAVNLTTGAGVPTGWLLCDGGLYNSNDYPALFSTIGNRYGFSGTQFRVPDLTLAPLQSGSTNIFYIIKS